MTYRLDNWRNFGSNKNRFTRIKDAWFNDQNFVYD